MPQNVEIQYTNNGDKLDKLGPNGKIEINYANGNE